MKNIYIMSAKFAPGHFSHLLAYYELFNANNYNSILYLDEHYNLFIQGTKYNYITIGSNINKIPDVLFIYNLSTKDCNIIRKFKKLNPNLHIIFVYHEPWWGIANCIENFMLKKESFQETIRALGRYFYAKRVLQLSHKVILPSKKALLQYKYKCVKYNANYTVIPLIFTDECHEKINLKNKRYFSFISTVSNSKNFEKFIEFLKYKANENNTLQFQIVTRSDISKYIDNDIKQLVKEKRLILNYGHPLSNTEINEAYNNSYCTWLYYQRSTQSGVLCKSFMFGTPVIASDVGDFKNYIHKNGCLLKTNANFDDIDNALIQIRKNLKIFSFNARKTFLENFSWESISNQLDIENLMK